jgi:hypothetical protein
LSTVVAGNTSTTIARNRSITASVRTRFTGGFVARARVRSLAFSPVRKATGEAYVSDPTVLSTSIPRSSTGRTGGTAPRSVSHRRAERARSWTRPGSKWDVVLVAVVVGHELSPPMPRDVGDPLGHGLAVDVPDGVEGVPEEGCGEEGLVPVPACWDEVAHPEAGHAAFAAS